MTPRGSPHQGVIHCSTRDSCSAELTLESGLLTGVKKPGGWEVMLQDGLHVGG